MKQEILSHFTTECPWRDTLYWYDTIESTNTAAKALAKDGAPHGTVLIAGSQTGGRGRLGRSFSSPKGMGVYLSVIIRPNCKPQELMHLTCAAAVAACQAVELVCGSCPDIKWTNDLVFGKKKLGGILTELGIAGNGTVDYAVVGIGINCCQMQEDFPAELQDMATSIAQISSAPCSPAHMTAALTEALYNVSSKLISDKSQLMAHYRSRCITLGQEISVVRGKDISHGTALAIDDDGGLEVRFTDGTTKTVASGEVSIRGMYGYL